MSIKSIGSADGFWRLKPWSLSEVCREQKVRWQPRVYWLDSYLHGGFAKLLEKAPVHREQLLSEQRQRIVRYMRLQKNTG